MRNDSVMEEDVKALIPALASGRSSRSGIFTLNSTSAFLSLPVGSVSSGSIKFSTNGLAALMVSSCLSDSCVRLAQATRGANEPSAFLTTMPCGLDDTCSPSIVSPFVCFKVNVAAAADDVAPKAQHQTTMSPIQITDLRIMGIGYQRR